MAKYVLGIAFGEDKCSIAVTKKEGGIQIIQHDFKCVIAFGENERIFGEETKDQEISEGKNTITGIRNLIGRYHNDPDVPEERSFQTSNQPDGRLGIKVKFLKKPRTFSPTQIAGMIFAKLKQIVEEKLKTEVTDAVIGLPCFFNDVRKEAVCNAARIAGLNVLEIMNETTASALNYAHSNLKTDENTRNAVFLNVGNIALQVSVVKFEKGTLTALATSVDPKFVNISNGIHLMDKIQIKETMEQCLNTSGINTEEICDVVAVGISSQPTIGICINEVFKKQPSTMNENEAVARGCALQAASLIFQNRKFKIKEVKPTFPSQYNTHNNDTYPKLTVGNLIEMVTIEEQLVQEEKDDRNRLDAKIVLEEYIGELKGHLESQQENKNSCKNYSEDLAKAIMVAEDLLDKEGENMLREDFVNILDEFKKYGEHIENGEFQDISSEEKNDDKSKAGESPQEQQKKNVKRCSSNVKDMNKKYDQQGEKKSSGSVKDMAQTFEQHKSEEKKGFFSYFTKKSTT